MQKKYRKLIHNVVIVTMMWALYWSVRKLKFYLISLFNIYGMDVLSNLVVWLSRAVKTVCKTKQISITVTNGTATCVTMQFMQIRILVGILHIYMTCDFPANDSYSTKEDRPSCNEHIWYNSHFKHMCLS